MDGNVISNWASKWMLEIIGTIIFLATVALIKILWKKLPFYRIKQLEDRLSSSEKSDPDKKWEEVKSKLKYTPNIYHDPNRPGQYYCAHCSDQERNLISISYSVRGLYCMKCKTSADLPGKNEESSTQLDKEEYEILLEISNKDYSIMDRSDVQDFYTKKYSKQISDFNILENKLKERDLISARESYDRGDFWEVTSEGLSSIKLYKESNKQR